MTMTAAGSAWPPRPPDHLIDLAEWEALPEDDSARYELVEGVMVVSPRPALRHQDLVFEFCAQLRAQLGDALTALPEVELVVDDGGGRGPATVRVPDLVVVPRAVVPDRARVLPVDVLAVLEIVSPGSRRTDRVAKLAEYAEVGIAHYVIVDPDGAMAEFVLEGVSYRLVAEHRGPAALAFGPTITR
ncbi:Uma2 family endonuclease [Actinomycetospora termitidis]|uniref:Uma2 family endonuclease n=1 Tax=Actinomycetospora termitidis TaxID=3053470 RepID=A0ABT7MD82_9PSEU|nr:Uma2 family endonuclease [Actinomycetospora sp. Odt1-22]MDL5158626.1 Uma2 family endonuclease [Actinomycetospora sp. Odt1-22]